MFGAEISILFVFLRLNHNNMVHDKHSWLWYMIVYLYVVVEVQIENLQYRKANSIAIA